MNSNRRQRELARAKFERQQERRDLAARRRKRGQRITAIVAVAVLVVAVVALIVVPNLSGDGGAPVAAASSPAADAATTPSASAQPSISSSPAAPSAAAQSDAAPSRTAAPVSPIACAPVPAATPASLSWPKPPTAQARPGTLTLATNCGDIVISVLADRAPATVASAQFLAQQGYFNATDCHRVTTAGIYVLQCGDPTGTGSGGPGYALPDENLPADGAANYPAGTVAMANAGPGTAGSQFFIVYQDTQLPPAYTIWGRVTQGLDIVQGVAAAGAYGGTGDGRPLQPITIEQATVSTG